MDDLAPVGAWLLLSGTWELDASLCCVTVLFQLASVVAAIRAPAIVQTRQRYQLFCFFAAITNQE